MTSTQKRILLTALTLLPLAGLWSCTKPYAKPLVVPESEAFPGVQDILQEGKAAKLVIIHGMCDHGVQVNGRNLWADETNKRFATLLHLEYQGLREIYATTHDSEVEIWQGLLKDKQDSGTSLVTYAIVYSGVTASYKQALCYDVSKPTDVCTGGLTYDRKRARLNGELKNNLLNNCLADAVIYSGKGGKAVSDAVEEAVSFVLVDQITPEETLFKEAEPTLVFLSESLGSKILYDALTQEKRTNRKQDKELMRVLGQVDQIFMGANQLPILELAERVPPPAAGLDDKPTPAEGAGPALQRFIDMIRKGREAIEKERAAAGLEREVRPERLRIVAFTDPNDLLSYELKPDRYPGADVINIIVSNDRTWFGYVENPLTAHQGYRKNASVLEFIACGKGEDAIESSSKADCPVRRP